MYAMYSKRRKSTERVHAESPSDNVTTPNTRECGKCKETITDKAKPIICDNCKKEFHKKKIDCTGITRWKIDKMFKEGIEWRCKECRSEPRNQMLVNQ